MNNYQEKIVRKQTARKGFVIDVVNNEVTKSFIFTKQNVTNLRAELDTYIEIFEKIMIDKLGALPSAIEEVKKEIHLRNTKDNQLLSKHWTDKTKSDEEKLELMKNEGLSDKVYNEIKLNIESKKEQQK